MSRRVLVQLDNLELGGAQINAVQLSAALQSLGFHSELIGPRETIPVGGPSLLDVAQSYNISVEPYDRPAGIRRHSRLLTAKAKAMNADIVHCFSTSERAAFWGPGMLGRRALVRTIYEMNFDPRTHPHVPVVIGTGYLRDELDGWPGGVTLISPPVDLSKDSVSVEVGTRFRETHQIDPEHTLLVIVGRLAERMKARGIEETIAAVARLNDPMIRLAVVGDGEARSRLTELGAKVNKDLGWRAVSFVGAMPDPRSAYAAADIVLGMGSSAARGLAFGKPLIVLGELGWSASFTEQNSRELFRSSFWSQDPVPNGSEALSGRIRELMIDPAIAHGRAEFGRRFAEENFGLEAMAARLAAVYEGAYESRSPASWVRDLSVESRLLRGKVERAIEVRTKGRFSVSSSSRSLQWKPAGEDNHSAVTGR